MSTTWAVLVILYLCQVFYGGSVHSATVLNNQTDTPKDGAHSITTLKQRLNQGPIINIESNKTKEKPRESLSDLRDYVFSFHHGTLATQVPVNEKKNPKYGWHVAIYSKMETPYVQICGGSLVKKDTAISAAHCFWDEAGLIPADQFAAVAGQTLRRWQEGQRYQSNVSEITIPPRFLGIQTNFQDDIAVVRLATPVDYQFGVRPVCVNFDLALERKVLRSGIRGLITGFGLTEANGEPSDVLNYQLLPYVDIRDCIAASDPAFLKYLTSDKICAGDQQTGRAVCRGDSGGGLIFFEGYNTHIHDFLIPHLHGVASAAPRDNNECNAFAIGSFTHVRAHRTFLRDHIPGLEEECKIVYAKEFAAMDGPYKLKPVKSKPNNKTENDSNINQQGINPDNTEQKTWDITTDNDSKIGAETDTERQRPVNTGELQMVANGTSGLVSSVGQDKLEINNPNATLSANVMQTGSVGLSNVNRPQKFNIPSGFDGNFNGPVKPSVSNFNENKLVPNIELPSKVKLGGNPETNIIFYTGHLVDPSKSYDQPNAAPGRPEQPTNIYVFIQN